MERNGSWINKAGLPASIVLNYSLGRISIFKYDWQGIRLEENFPSLARISKKSHHVFPMQASIVECM